MYALATSVAFFDFIGMHQVKPVSIQTPVNAYRLPLLEGG